MRYTAIAFLVLAIGGCGNNGPPPKAFTMSDAMAEGLAVEIMKNTPEFVHYESGVDFSWVEIDFDATDAPENVKLAVRKKIDAKYSIYKSYKNAPRSSVTRESDGSLAHFNDGFSFRFTVSWKGRNRVKVEYEDWESPLASSSHWTTYEWRGGKWKLVEESGALVS